MEVLRWLIFSIIVSTHMLAAIIAEKFFLKHAGCTPLSQVSVIVVGFCDADVFIVEGDV